MCLRVQAFASDKVLKAINETWEKGMKKKKWKLWPSLGDYRLKSQQMEKKYICYYIINSYKTAGMVYRKTFKPREINPT